VVLTAAALLRLGLMVVAYARTETRIMTQGDTASYLEPGRNLLLHGAFADGLAIEIDRTPGYPLFAELTGMWAGNVLATIVVQIGLSLLSLLLVKRIGSLVFADWNAGMAAAWLFAIEPISITYSVRVMPETLFTFLLLLVLERLVIFQTTGRLVAIVGAGFALVAATYVRPVSYYLAPLLAAGLLISTWMHYGREKGRWWKAPALLLLISVPLLGAWQVRNWTYAGYQGFSSIVDKNLYFYQAAGVSAWIDHTPLAEEQARLGYPDEEAYLAVHPEQRSWSQAERLAYMRGEGLRVVKAHPAIALQSQIAGVAVVALTPDAAEFLELLRLHPEDVSMPKRVLNEGAPNSAWRVIEVHPLVAGVMGLFEAYLVAVYLLAVVGMVKFMKGSRVALLTLCGVGLYFLLVSGGAQAVGRYRLPVMPELCVLAGGGLVVVRKRRAGPLLAPHAQVAVEVRS